MSHEDCDFHANVNLYIECANLQNKDILSKSDPCAVLYMSHRGQKDIVEIGRTETIINSHNPRFATPIKVTFRFEEVQNIIIRIYDVDNKKKTFTDRDLLGEIGCTLGEIVSRGTFTHPLKTKKKRESQITIRSNRIKKNEIPVKLAFKARYLDKKDLLSKSDPFLEILKKTQNGEWQVVHRSEVIKNNLSPVWKPFTIPLHNLCDGDIHRELKIDCYDHDSDGGHDFIGGFVTSVRELMKAKDKKELAFPCVNPKKAHKDKKYVNSGVVYLTSCDITWENAFIDYVVNGLKIHLTIGIDFTLSNGNPHEKGSLHHIDPDMMNEYVAAIRAVSEVCEAYDTDKIFTALGFGARVLPERRVSFSFPINMNYKNPDCKGINGVLNAYTRCFNHIELSGPTNVAPIINYVAKLAESAQSYEAAKGAHAYYVLLILLDGLIDDKHAVEEAIANASHLPMSLIFIGIGTADFRDMAELNGGHGVLGSISVKSVERNNIQFVAFRDFKTNTADMGAHVMARIPQQITEYFSMRHLPPNTH